MTFCRLLPCTLPAAGTPALLPIGACFTPLPAEPHDNQDSRSQTPVQAVQGESFGSPIGGMHQQRT
jgi:hypothetical protein